MRAASILTVLLFGMGLTLAGVAQGVTLTGHWEGTIILVAAEREVDVVVDFNQAAGMVKGQLLFPMAGDGAQAVNDLAVQGNHVSFSVRDKSGVVSMFEGDLSPDGNSFKGTLKENGRPLPFLLRRSKAASPTRPASLHKLSDDGAQLREAFNKDIDKTRMILLLDLGSFSAKMALRVVHHYVLDQISDSNLRVYVVWRAPNSPDTAKIASVLQQDATLATDPRITQFWFTAPSLAAVFEPMLAPYEPVSNPCLLFAPGRSWTVKAPLPDRLRQSPKMGAKTQATPGQKLNGIELAWDVQTLLGAKKSR